MNLIPLFVLMYFFTHPLELLAEQTEPSAQITVAGVVYCDVCFTNTFSRHSYFLPGMDVNLQCKFKADSPKTAEQITLSVNRTTDVYGVYKMEIPSVDGVNCVDGLVMESMCRASLIGSPSLDCNVRGLKTTSNQMSVKSKQDNLCLYSLNALTYRPYERNATLCRNQKEVMTSSLNSSKFFLPYFPPYGFPWPPFPPFPCPPLPPFPSLPFPPFPTLPPLPFLPFPPFTFPSPPSLPFPFPPIPPFPPTQSLLSPPPPPAFNLGDPRTWIPNIPSSPPPPPFNLRDPRTWIPIPSSTPPPTPFNPQDPRTWIPNIPSSSPPSSPFNPQDPRTWIPNIPSSSPSSPPFNLGDPRTWIPNVPSSSPPPAFNLGDPRTWIPNTPSSSPTPHAYDPRDSRTWIPDTPPSLPTTSQDQKP